MTENHAPEHDEPRSGKPSPEEIATRAYFLHQHEQGNDVEISMQAQRELTEREREAAKREPDPASPGKG